MGIGHMPLAHAAFARMDPSFISLGAVFEEELEGWRYWQEEGGGYIA